MSTLIHFTKFLEIIPIFVDLKNILAFYIVYFIAIVLILLIISLIIILSIFSNSNHTFIKLSLQVFKQLILLIQWVLCIPMIEIILNPLLCSLNASQSFYGTECYQGGHLAFFILSIIFLTILFFVCTIVSILFNEGNNVVENSMSRFTTYFEFEIVVLKFFITIITHTILNSTGFLVIQIILIIICVLLCLQYLQTIPFFNPIVSIAWGSSIFSLTWVLLVGFFSQVFNLNGNILILLIGIPLIVIFVKTLRDYRINSLFIIPVEKQKSDHEALIQISSLQILLCQEYYTSEEEIRLKGYVNLHCIDCQSMECPCRRDSDLYDAKTDKYSDRTLPHHLDKIFLNQLNRKLYEDAIKKFPNSSTLILSYAFFLFNVLQNIHASYIEICNSEKKQPSFYQQFQIFCLKKRLEYFLKISEGSHKVDKSDKSFKDNKSLEKFLTLPYIIRFENLILDCQKNVEKKCNFQKEFWSQLTNVYPDLNALNEIQEKIVATSKQIELVWKEICKINPYHKKALTTYYTYLLEIKNNPREAEELIEKAKNKTDTIDLNIQNKISSSLFSEDTAVVHISGSPDSPGKILKVNQGFTKIFGYSKSEGIGHFVNILMPPLYSNKHSQFLETYFRTGRNKLFCKERINFALHRNGFCFLMKIFIKQLPNLKEGIEYVGMIKALPSDKEYILTDSNGFIDSFSQGIGSLIQLSSIFFKENKINIKLIMPELINVINNKQKDSSTFARFKENGGKKLRLLIPNKFQTIAKNENNKNHNPNEPLKGSNKEIFKHVNRLLLKNEDVFKHYSLENILNSDEYLYPEVNNTVKCEIHEMEYGSTKEESLKILMFKIAKYEQINFDNNENQEFEEESSFDKKHFEQNQSLSNESFDQGIEATNEDEYSLSEQLREEKIKMLNYLLHSKGKDPHEKEFKYGKLNKKPTEKEIIDDKPNKIQKELPLLDLSDLGISHADNAKLLKKEVSVEEEEKEEEEEEEEEEEKEKEKDQKDEKQSKMISLHSSEDTQRINLKMPFSEDSTERVFKSIAEKNKQEGESQNHVGNRHPVLNETFVQATLKPNIKPNNMIEINPQERIIEEKKNENLNKKDAVNPLLIPFDNDNNNDDNDKNDKKHEGIGKPETKKDLSNSSNLLELDQDKRKNSKVIEEIMMKRASEIQRRRDKISKIIFIPDESKNENESEEYIETEEEKKFKKNFQESITRQNKRDSSENQKDERNNDEYDESENEVERKGGNKSANSLRAAIEEKYIPAAVKNLQLVSVIVFLIFIALSITYFTLQVIFYTSSNDSYKNFDLSEKRIDYLIDINLRVISLILINLDTGNPGYINPSIKNDPTIIPLLQSNLKEYATVLKNAQNQISVNTASMGNQSLQIINQQNISLAFIEGEDLGDNLDYSLWQSIMEISVCTYRIAANPITLITLTDSAVYFVNNNSFSSIIVSLRDGTNEIMNVAEKSLSDSLKIFLYILLIASFFFIVSIVFIIPILRKIKKNKEQVYELFMFVNKKEVQVQINRCNTFLIQFHCSNESEIMNNQEALFESQGKEENESNIADTEKVEEVEDSNLKKRHKFKKLITNIGVMIVKFIIMLIIIEGYFLMIFFFSMYYLNSVSFLFNELKNIISSKTINSYLLLMEKQILLSQGNTSIEKQLGIDFVSNYQKNNYNQIEIILDLFSKNQKYHSDTYKNQFTNIMYLDVCNSSDVFVPFKSECYKLDEGILTKGLYSSIVKYWDYLIQVFNDFLPSDRDTKSIQKYLNDSNLIIAERMQSFYFNESLSILINQMELDLDNRYNLEIILNRLYFSLFIIYVIFVYLFLWRNYVESIQNELWKAKTVLAIFPCDLLVSIPNVREYILRNSSTSFYSKSKL